MKAEDTVMNIEQINKLPINRLSGLPTPVDVAEAQAKITWVLAVGEVVGWLKRHKCYTENNMIIDGESLQTKLKEWTVEVDGKIIGGD